MKNKLLLIGILLFGIICITNNVWAINVGSGLCQEKTGDIGRNYTDVIKIINKEDKSVEVKLYQTDFLFFSDGTNQFGEPGKISRSNANWIAQLPQRITIPPEQTIDVQYSVNVPMDQNLQGSYWSMIMVEEVNQADMESISAGKNQTGIRQMVRYGVQVLTHIGSSGTRQLDFKGLKIVKAKNGRLLQVNMENSGTRALRPHLWIDFYADNGSYSKKVNGNLRRIYPECSISESLDLSEIPPGSYKAVVVADAGEETVFGTSFSLKLEE